MGLSWELIPDPIPIHWGANGEPDDWIPKSVGHIIGFLALGGGILSAIAVIVPWLIHQNAKHAHRGLPKKTAWEINQIRATANEMMKLTSKFLFFVTLFTVGMVTYSLIGRERWSIPTWLVITVIVIFITWLINSVRKADQRINTNAEHEENDTDPQWKPFYFNSKDKRMLIDNNFGLTLNFGHIGSWILIVLIFSPAIIAVIIAFLDINVG